MRRNTSKPNLPLNAGLDHITSHEFQSLVEMRGEFRIGPMKVPNERLEGVQFPEQVLGGGTAIAVKKKEWRLVGGRGAYFSANR